MLCTTCETRWHLLLGQLECLLRDVTQEGLVKRLQRHSGVCHHVPCCSLALRHAEIVIAAHKAAGKTGEYDSNLKLRHTRILLDYAILL